VPDVQGYSQATTQEPLNVLVVEDDESLRAVITDLLSDHGFAVATAECSCDVLDLVAALRPVLVILDIMIRPDDGLVVLRNIKRFFPKQRVLLMTAYLPDQVVTTDEGYDGTRESFIRLGAWDFLAKPFEINDLLHLVYDAAREAKV